MWCHLLLGMPIFALALFFVFPWQVALIVYVPVAAFSLLVYYKIAVALRLPVSTGKQSVVGTTGEVVGVTQQQGLASHLVRCRGEIWSVRAKEPLAIGERVCFTGFDGAWPLVQRLGNDGDLSVDGAMKQNAESCCH
ncbi:MAG: hypothetical protein M1298_01130 [Chloroflexi bacterium]|nr:hypothetical protein [Chloroflexota bacterium]